MNNYLEKLLSGMKVGVLFSKKPMVVFHPDIKECPICGSKLLVKKTWEKDVITMDIGIFRAKEFVLECPKDKTVFPSSLLRSIVPAQGTYGFDVIVEVGMALWVRCRNELEIMKDLAAKNISISEREIGYLGRKFIVYLALAHREIGESLACFMQKKGGYILHVDGTCEGDSPNLFCGIDGISKIVLGSVKIPSERKDLLIAFFQRIKELYGVPIAMVHDMGVGIIAALEEVFQGVADYICHFHFLRDVGKDLLLEDYQNIIRLLRKHAVRSQLKQKARYLGRKNGPDADVIAGFNTSLITGELQIACNRQVPEHAIYLLINWAFESPRESGGYGFPFDKPQFEFYRRLKEIRHYLKEIIDIDLHGKTFDSGPYIQVAQLLDKVLGDKELSEVVESFKQNSEVFDRLREALRIALPEGKNGLNDDGNDESDIKTIEKRVTRFREWLASDEKRKQLYSKMIEQLDKYWKKLFADPLSINTPEGPIIIPLQRTNNILERFFRCMKRMSRKRSGTASLSKTLKTILADTPLVRNLENEEYRGLILNGCSTLAERFSQIDEKLVREQLKQAESAQEKMPSTVKKIIRQSDLPQKIWMLYQHESKKNANRHLRS